MMRQAMLLAAGLPAGVAGPALAREEGRRPAGLRANIAQTIEKKNSDQDLLRVHVTYVRKVGEKYVCHVIVRWGDLDNQIARGGREHYSKWDGSITVAGGKAELVRRLAFDDRSGNDPRPGSGIDKLGEQSEAFVSWHAAVVGWTDGLAFKLTLDGLDSVATVRAGAFTITVVPIEKK